jgi:hypothetical protein
MLEGCDKRSGTADVMQEQQMSHMNS